MIGQLSVALLYVVVFAASPAAPSDQPRYVGALIGGDRIEGNRLVDWHDEQARPKLDGIDLGDPRHDLRWLRDRLATSDQRDGTQGLVHLAGGDRLVGHVVRFSNGDGRSSAGTPPHLVIQPAMPWHHPEEPQRAEVRVLAEYVQRITGAGWKAVDLPPGTLVLKGGDRISWQKLRWNSDGITVLGEAGVRHILFAEIMQLEMRTSDAWEAYYDQLAVLNPAGSSNLIRVELQGGSALTASTARHAPAGLGNTEEIDSWYHIMQPAWSLDPLWLRCATIDLWQIFPPHEVSLSRLNAIATPQRPATPRPWPWQRDRNLLRGPLVGGGHEYGWGFGVHAYQQLSFELPDLAIGFRSVVGLDATAGNGDCARAEVFVGEPVRQPLYRSPHLIGSAKVVETGPVRLDVQPGRRRSLVLVADDAHADRPDGTDPLNIRDMVDWLEPVLLLDREKLAERVRFRAAGRANLPADWRPTAGSEMQISNVWINRQAGYRTANQARGGPFRFGRDWTPAAGENYLLLGATHREKRIARVSVRINGVRVAQLEIPAAQEDRLPNPVAVTLLNYIGKAVTVDHVYLARRVEDFDEIEATRLLEPSEANALARIAASNKSLYAAMRATVQLDIEGYRGSGIVVTEDGFIASTAYVVAAPGRDVLVTGYDGHVVKGKTLGMDRGLNAGLVRIIDEGHWHHAPLADAWPGSTMFVLAHVSDGGSKRNIEHVQAGMRGAIGGLAWTNVGISQIHSGGPLFTTDGQVVGLHSQASPLGGGLHVPAVEIKKRWDKLVRGEVLGSWQNEQLPVLGITAHNVDGGCVVQGVTPATPAAENDVRAGDRLVMLAGQAIADENDIRKILAVRNPGDEMPLVIERDGERLTITIRIAQRPLT